MNSFSKKAILKDSIEWDDEYKRTRGGDGFPSSWHGSYPVLVLEADNPEPKAERLSRFTDKVYIFIERNDILELIG